MCSNPPPDRHLAWRVNGQPVPQKRHRHTHAGRVYDPSTTAKRDFLAATQQACRGLVPFTEPLVVRIQFHFARPKSHYKKHGALRKGAPVYHTQTPDVDNLIKFVFDAINGHVFHDDKQVISVYATKLWSDTGFTSVWMHTFSCDPSNSASPQCPFGMQDETIDTDSSATQQIGSGSSGA